MEKSQQTFAEFVHSSVEELKKALEAGEISRKEYDEAVKSLTGDA